jgi:hypothetical protein
MRTDEELKIAIKMKSVELELELAKGAHQGRLLGLYKEVKELQYKLAQFDLKERDGQPCVPNPLFTQSERRRPPQ